MPRSGRRPTIADVAQAAGVSVTTVSDAMSGKGRVDPATRERVREAAAAAGWQPRRAAQSLRSGRTSTIALCIPPDRRSWAHWMRNSDYFQQLTASCAAAAIDAGWQLLLAPRPADRAELAGFDVDGLVLADPVRDDQVVALCAEAGLPVVTIDRQPGAASTSWVGNDHVAGVRRGLDHLAERGATTIALLTGAEPWGWFDDARTAYGAWCATRRQRPIVRHIDLDLTVAAAAEATAALLAEGVPLDGVLAQPTSAALGVVSAALAHGLRVPDDLRVVAGVDGVAPATSGITALDLQPDALGHAAVALLRHRLDQPAAARPPGPIVVDVRLHVRTSS